MNYEIIRANDEDNFPEMANEVAIEAANAFLQQGLARDEKHYRIKLLASGLGTLIASNFGINIIEKTRYSVTYFFGEPLAFIIRVHCAFTYSFSSKSNMCR